MIKFIIAQGIGFSPGSVKYIPTLGFASSVIVPPDIDFDLVLTIIDSYDLKLRLGTIIA
jgi:hypothetical protein